MKTTSITVFVLSALALASALPSVIDTQVEQERFGNLNEEGGRGWQTWNAIRNWLSPATNYITQSLPEKTPVEVAYEVRDAAVDLRDRAQDHPVVQGVANVVKPVGTWVKDQATSLSKTSFRDMYDSAVNSVLSADERLGAWLNTRSQQQQALPQQDGIEILH